MFQSERSARRPMTSSGLAGDRLNHRDGDGVAGVCDIHSGPPYRDNASCLESDVEVVVAARVFGAVKLAAESVEHSECR